MERLDPIGSYCDKTDVTFSFSKSPHEPPKRRANNEQYGEKEGENDISVREKERLHTR